jgi:hypothetical protein
MELDYVRLINANTVDQIADEQSDARGRRSRAFVEWTIKMSPPRDR